MKGKPAMESTVIPLNGKKQKGRKQTTDPQLAKLYEQERAIKARIAARLNKEKKAERSAETQRLILTGRAMESWGRRNSENAAILAREIDAFCTRPIDRQRMGLHPLPGAAEPEAKKA